MENASKALIIAGAILVSIMIVSLGVLLFNRMQKPVIDMANMDEQEIAAFNSKITPYLGNTISGSQVNALIQYIISNDIACVQSGETYKAITIVFPISGGTNTINIDNINSPGTKRVETGANKYYKVRGTPDANGLITIITVDK